MCWCRKNREFRTRGFRVEDYLRDTSEGKRLEVSPESYIENRVKDQINWYNESAQYSKGWFVSCKRAILIFSALIPLVAAFGDCFCLGEYQGIISSILGVLVIIATGFMDISKFQEKCVSYRRTAEELKREFMLFSALQYNAGSEEEKKKNFREFVERFEGIIDAENQSWKRYINREKTEEQPEK